MKKNIFVAAFAACTFLFAAPTLSAQVVVEWESINKTFPAKPDMVSLEGWSIVKDDGKDAYIPTIRVLHYEIDDTYVYEYMLCTNTGRYTMATVNQAKYDFDGMTTIFLKKIPLSTFTLSYWGETIEVEYEENDSWQRFYKDDALGLALSKKYQKPFYVVDYQLKPERTYEAVRYEDTKREEQYPGEVILAEEISDKSGSESSIYMFKFSDEANAKAFAAKLKTKLERRFVYKFDKLSKHSSSFTKEQAKKFAAQFTSICMWRTLDKVDKITFTFADGETVTATYSADIEKDATKPDLTLSDLQSSANAEDYALTLSLYALKIGIGNPMLLEFWNLFTEETSPALQLEFKQ